MSRNKCIEFKGRIIDPSKITNPHLAKVFRRRVYNNGGFMFRRGYKDWEQHKEHKEYSPWREKYSEEWKEYKEYFCLGRIG